MTGDESANPFAELSTADLESRLCTLSARIAAAECEFLLLLAEFEARQGWGPYGVKSAAHWLSWRTGMRLGVARERLRVARRLNQLPLIRDAFAAGRLSYCKVRALSRVATPPTEPDLLEVAVGATGAQLERFARAWRTCLVGESSASNHIRRGLSRREEEDGSVVYTLRVPPESSVVVDAAIDAARQAIRDADGRPVETPEEAALADAITAEPASHRSDSDAFVLMAQAFLAADTSADAPDRTTVVVHTDLAGLAAALDEVPAVHPEPDVDAAPKADTRADAARTSPAPIPDGGAVAQRSLATRPSGAVLDTGARVAMSSVVRMLCDSPIQLMVHAADGRPLDLGRTKRHASPSQRRALHARDGGCRFPSCTQQRRLIPHHVHWWSRETWTTSSCSARPITGRCTSSATPWTPWVRVASPSERPAADSSGVPVRTPPAGPTSPTSPR
jgi:hypothetical protein